MNSFLLRNTLFILLLALFSNSLAAKTGGHCQYFDFQRLAKVTNTSPEIITLKTSDGSNRPLKIELSKFKQTPTKNDFVTVHIREHTSGGCSPFDIQRVSPLNIANIDFNPEAGHLYQAAFATAALKGCSKQVQCAKSHSIIKELSSNSLIKLQSLQPKTLKSCSIELIEKHLESVDQSNMEQRFIACGNSDSEGKVLLEFVILRSKVKGNPVELIKVY
ncbi:MAG: hypothetical protein ABJI60_00275 [Kangiellaceae bacterium]|jgi:hypothetical protein